MDLGRPGDYLPPDADEISGFKERLNERLAPMGSQFSGDGVKEGEWEIGDTLAQWWRPNFETFMYPFLPAHVTRPKECKKLYFVKLPKSSRFPFFRLDPSSYLSVRRNEKVPEVTDGCRGSQRAKEHEASCSSIV